MVTRLSAVGITPGQTAPGANAPVPGGLSDDEARRRLQKSGPNAMPDSSEHAWSLALEKFWAPVTWMLEAAILLQVVLGKFVEAAIIAALLVFNAAPGMFQESRAQRAGADTTLMGSSTNFGFPACPGRACRCIACARSVCP